MGIEFLYLEEKNNCVFLIKIRGTEKGLYEFQLQSPSVTPREARGKKCSRAEKRTSSSAAGTVFGLICFVSWPFVTTPL